MAKYLISRIGDPLFALFIGVSAAVVRVRREENEAGRTGKEAWGSLLRNNEVESGDSSRGRNRMMMDDDTL
ncbi:hypothetical protein RUND412_005816 [Rhizina undulata]